MHSSKQTEQPFKKNLGQNPRTTPSDLMSTLALRSSWEDNGEGSTSKNLGFTTEWPRENDTGKRKKKKRHREIYEKVLQRRTDSVRRRRRIQSSDENEDGSFSAVIQRMREMREKWGRFDLTLFKSQEADAFIARGWKISKCQWPIWVHHNLSPSYFIIKYSSQQLTCTGRTACHVGIVLNSVFTANLFRCCDSSLLVKITRLNSDYRVTFYIYKQMLAFFLSPRCRCLAESGGAE